MVLNVGMIEGLNEMLTKYQNEELSLDELRVFKNMLLIMANEVSDHMDELSK